MRDRSQSTIIGFVLMFGILILLLLILQTSAVPAWNQDIEVSHNERVQSDMEALRDGVFRSATTGSATSQSIALGTRYPVRPFLLNPPNPTGSIRTTESGTVRITNATAAGETGDYWNGSTREFDDKALLYRPNYNEYRNAPTTFFENTVLYDQYDERPVPASGTRLVNGRRITVVTLDGGLSRSSQGSRSIDIEPLSAPQQVTSVRSDGQLVITTPTRLPEEQWEQLLADERVEADGHVTDITVTPGEPGTLRLTLEAGQSYDLRMANVGIGAGLDEPGAHYITTDSPSELRLTDGQTERITFEVRDRYNNPVSGVEVNASIGPSDKGALTPVDALTDTDGEAVFEYEAIGTGTATIEATFGPEPERDARRTANVTVESVPTSATAESPLTVEWTGPSSGEDDTYTLDAGDDNTTDLTVTSSPTVGNLGVEYVVDDPSIGTVSPIQGATDADGQNTTTFTAENDGTVNVYAVGGGDVDKMAITVTNVTAASPPVVDSVTVTNESKTTGTPKYAQFTTDYTVSDGTGLDSVRVTAVRQSDGTRVLDNTTTLSGTSASGSETFRDSEGNANVRGTTYDVTVSVTDASGQTATVTRTVTVR